ncbi:MAG: ABC transporter substrate-binding protein [bacterium]|nr:ABC transporter substrate-binding protein [bacterium]
MTTTGKFLAMGLMLALFVSASCSRSSEAIHIGAALATTGPAAMLGTPEKNSVEMLVKEINGSGGIGGVPLKVICYDTEGDPTKTVMVVKKLINKDNVVAIVGPTTSGTTLAVMDLVEQAGVPLVSCASSRKIVQPLLSNVFKVTHSDSLVVEKIYDKLRKDGNRKVALLTVSDGFGSSGREALLEMAGRYGIEVIADERFGASDTSMMAQLTRIKGSGSQALICWGTNPGPAIVAKNARQLGITMPIYNSHGVASKKFIELAGKDAEGIMLPVGKVLIADQLPDSDPQKPVLMKYREDYQKAYNEPANTFGGHGYDAVRLLAAALEEMDKLGVKVNREGVRSRLDKTASLPGIGGVYNLSSDDHNGLTIDGLVMVRIEEGAWKIIE